MSVIRTVDDAISIFTVAAHYRLDWGYDTGRPQQVHCPMHNDSTPSARVYPGEGAGGYCWTCQQAFGPSRLAAEQEGVSITAAAHLLARRYGIDLTPDVDLAAFRELAERYEAGPPSDTPAARRAASLAVRAAGLPWETAQRLLPLYDALDAGELKPLVWLDLVRSGLPLTQPLT